jgi:hypothetical protein
MTNYQAELNKVSKTVQKQIAETEEKIGEVQNEFAKTLDVHVARHGRDRAWPQTVPKTEYRSFAF